MRIKMKAIAILLSLVVLSGIAVASACSTRTPGYWKNHYTEAWVNSKTDLPVTATITYQDIAPAPTTLFSWTFPGGSPAAAEDILLTPNRGDAKINLQQKVIAAMLSISADNREGWNWPLNYAGGPMGGKTLPVLITESIALINANTEPWTPRSDSGVRAQGLALAGAIDHWLNFFDEAPIT